MNPLAVAVAAGAAVLTFLLTREDQSACFDKNLPADVKELAQALLKPETGKENLEALTKRTAFMRQAAKTAAKDGYPKLSKCLNTRAEQLEGVIRKAGGKVLGTPPTPPPSPPKGGGGAKVPPKGGGGKPVAPPASPPQGGGGVKVMPPSKNPPGAPGSSAPDGSFGLPVNPGPARDAKILELVKERRLRPLEWKAIDCSRDGHTCTVYVSTDAVALGDANSFLRPSVRHSTAEQIAFELGQSYLPTTRISDLAWAQADTRLTPHPLGTKDMAKTPRMYVHNRAVEKERAARGGLVRPVGKDWVTSNSYYSQFNKHVPEETAINFGWQMTPDMRPKLGVKGFTSPGGLLVVQPLSTFHSNAHTDYSQVVTLVKNVAIVDGAMMPLGDLLQHPTLSKLVSDEGPIKTLRHPGADLHGLGKSRELVT